MGENVRRKGKKVLLITHFMRIAATKINDHTFTLTHVTRHEKKILIFSELQQILVEKYGQTYG